MRRVLKLLLGLMIINSIVWAAGQALTRSKSSKDLGAEDVELYTFWNGAEHVLRSDSLKSAKARILMGGATIDLRESEPSDQGATVDVATTLGGAAVLVRKDWDVDVIEETRNAEVEIRLDSGAAASSDAPKMTIRLATTLGGAFVGYELPKDSTT